MKSAELVDWPASLSERRGCDSQDGAALCLCAQERTSSGGHSACRSIHAGTGSPAM